MRKIFLVSFLIIAAFMANSQTKVILSIGDKSMTASLGDNAATRELKALLEKGPVTIQMSDYGGFEKVGMLPQSFTTSNSQITTVPGDIMLYQGNNMVIFYGSNSWSYTRIGKIDGATASNLKEFLGSGNISLSLSLNPGSGIEDMSKDSPKEEIIYDLNGNRVINKPLVPGVYIIDGKKVSVSK